MIYKEEEERLYKHIIGESFNCKIIKDVQELLKLYQNHTWNDTNNRMLEWVLKNKLKQITRETLSSKVVESDTNNKIIVVSSLKKNRKEFLKLHLN